MRPSVQGLAGLERQMLVGRQSHPVCYNIIEVKTAAAHGAQWFADFCYGCRLQRDQMVPLETGNISSIIFPVNHGKPHHSSSEKRQVMMPSPENYVRLAWIIDWEQWFRRCYLIRAACSALLGPVSKRQKKGPVRRPALSIISVVKLVS